MRLVKVLWQHQGVEKAIWEQEDTIHANYPFLFKAKGMFLVINTKLLLHVHVIVCVCTCEFQ